MLVRSFAFVRCVFLGVILFIFSSQNAYSQTMLVSNEEFLAEQREGNSSNVDIRYAGSLVVGAPLIEIKFPDVNKPITVPTRIQIRFVIQPPAEPDLSSFKIRYGQKQWDITDRVLPKASLSKEGLNADSVSLPPGHHQLSVTIADSLGRQTIHVFKLSIQ